jgi:hypothetical protein
MTAPLHLNFVEEITLLALDDATGTRLPVSALALDYALAGALLCELSLLNRLDTDPAHLTVISAEPTGDTMLDEALALIAAAGQPSPVSRWLGFFAARARGLQQAAYDRLVARGILRCEKAVFLWVHGTRRYPTVDHRERAEVRTRLAALILGDDLPDARDAGLLSLLHACRLTDVIFSGPEFAARAGRVANLARMDLVGREAAVTFATVKQALASVVPLGM